MDSSYFKEQLEKVQDKLDVITLKLSDLELKLTKKVYRNTIILNGILWAVGVLASLATGLVIVYCN